MGSTGKTVDGVEIKMDVCVCVCVDWDVDSHCRLLGN